MKDLYLIGGTMGVGKTTVCQLLKQRLPNAVFLDGDWCWDAAPFQVTAETKMMVMENICFLLNQFLRCSAYQNILFCWVMHEQSILDELCKKLDLSQCRTHVLSLVCTPAALTQRLERDICQGVRQPDILQRSIQRLSLYPALNTLKIDTTDLTPAQTAQIITDLCAPRPKGASYAEYPSDHTEQKTIPSPAASGR